MWGYKWKGCADMRRKYSIVSTIICLLFALAALAGCGPEPQKGTPSSEPDLTPPLGQPAEPQLTEDEALLQMRAMLLDGDNAFFCEPQATFSGTGPRRVQTDVDLLEGIARLLCTTPCLRGGWTDFEALEGSESIYISGGDGETTLHLTVDLAQANGGEGSKINLQIGVGAEDDIIASYLYNDRAVYDSILKMAEERYTANTTELEGEYTELELEADLRVMDVLEIDGRLVMLTMSSVFSDAPSVYFLELVDPHTGSSSYHEELGPHALGLQVSEYGDYEFRVKMRDGRCRYYTTKDMANATEIALPEALAGMLDDALLEFGDVKRDASYDIDAQSGLAAVCNGEKIRLVGPGVDVTLDSSEIPTEGIEDYDPKTAIPPIYTQVRLLNGGRSLMADCRLPTGPSGVGQGWNAGYLVYNIATGEKYWMYDVFLGFNPDFQYPGGRYVLGMRQALPGDTGPKPARLNLDTMEVTNDVYYPQERYANDPVYLYQYYAYNRSSLLPDGRTETVFTVDCDGTPRLLLTVRSARTSAFSAGLTENYLLVLLSEHTGERYLLLQCK